MKENMDKIKIWLPAIAAGLLVGANMLPNVPNLPNVLGHSLYLWFTFGLLILQIIILNKRLSDVENTHPYILADDYGFTKMEDEFPLWAREIRTPHTVKRFFLSLRNKGQRAVDTTPVHASISFYNM